MENRNYEQGYRSALTKLEKRRFRTEFCQKSAWKGISLTFFTAASIYFALWACFYVINGEINWIVSVILMMVTLIFITRQMRALENIVHFGSHNNFFSRQSRNDLMTNALAAWPMLQDVRQYRKFHATHHGDYGSHDDPCKERLQRIGAGPIEINNNWQLIYAILLWMPAYVREFYNEVKSSNQQAAIFLIWHSVVIFSMGFVISWSLAAFCVGAWIVAMFGILPFLRSIAEFSEHDYELGNTVRETTFNNLGLLDHLLLHPAGDAWHALHHLHPTVPWWNQGAAHRFLMERDEAYRQAHHRDSLLQDIAFLPSSNDEIGTEDQSGEPKFAV